MKLHLLLGSAILLSQPLCAQSEEAKDTLTTQMRLTHNYRLGLSYAFADNHQLSLAYTGKWDSSHSHHETMGTSTSLQHGNEHIYLHNIDASYTLPFGLQLGASHLYYKNPRQQNLEGTTLDNERILDTNSKQVIDKWLFTADQSHSLKHGWSSTSISVIYKIGNYKEKRTKDVDTSRMGIN